MYYDIFISYKRLSINFANNLYYRLSIRGYSVFFDLDEMRRDRFDIQIYEYIDNAKDVFVILEEGSLKSIYDNSYKADWFCQEVAYAIRQNKNIIPILINGYEMPEVQVFPQELAQLPLTNSLTFGGISYFDDHINKLERKKYLNSTPNRRNDIQNLILKGQFIYEDSPRKHTSKIIKVLFIIAGIGVFTIEGIRIYNSLIIPEEATVRTVDAQIFDKPAINEPQIPIKEDVTKTLESLMENADPGDITVFSALGKLYRRKESPLYDIDKAIGCYQKAVDAGFADGAEILLELEREKLNSQK